MGTCAREQVSVADALHLGTGDIDLETILLFRCNKRCSSLGWSGQERVTHFRGLGLSLFD